MNKHNNVLGKEILFPGNDLEPGHASSLRHSARPELDSTAAFHWRNSRLKFEEHDTELATSKQGNRHHSEPVFLNVSVLFKRLL